MMFFFLPEDAHKRTSHHLLLLGHIHSFFIQVLINTHTHIINSDTPTFPYTNSYAQVSIYGLQDTPTFFANTFLNFDTPTLPYMGSDTPTPLHLHFNKPVFPYRNIYAWAFRHAHTLPYTTRTRPHFCAFQLSYCIRTPWTPHFLYIWTWTHPFFCTRTWTRPLSSSFIRRSISSCDRPLIW